MTRLILCAVAASIMCLIVRNTDGRYVYASRLAAGALLLLGAYPYICDVIDLFKEYSSVTGEYSQYASMLLRLSGAAVITELACGVCSDAGEEGIAQRLSLAGRAVMLAMCLPAVRGILTVIASLLEG